MQTANELLYGILQVAGKIEQNTRSSSKPGIMGGEEKSKTSLLSNLGGALQSFAKVTPKAVKNFISFMDQMLITAKKSEKSSKNLKDISQALLNMGQGLPGLTSGLTDLSKVKASNVERSVRGLHLLYDFMEQMGEPNKVKKVDRAIKTFDKIGKSLQKVAKPLKDISLSFIYLGVGILAFAGSLLLSGIILKVTKPTDVLLFLGMTILTITIMFTILYAAKKYVQVGIGISKDMGIGMATIALGILAFSISMILTAALLKTESPTDALIFLGVTVLGITSLFIILWMANKFVKEGTKSAIEMGLGMVALAVGIFSFALILKVIPMILGKESGGTIAKSMLLMLGIVVGMTAMFAILSFTGNLIKQGFISILLMSIGLAVLSFAILSLAYVSKQLMTGITPASASKKEKDDNKKEVLNGLGIIGLIILAAVALFLILGIPVVAGLVSLGAGVAILMAASLFIMGKSIQSLMGVAKKIGNEDIAGNLSKLIGGVLEGFIQGLAPLSGGKKGVKGIVAFMANSAKIFAGVAVLMAVSIALSMFAWAISAFAELETMKPIIGTKKDGSPIFGEKVNVVQVGRNMTLTLSTFLTELLTSTNTLTLSKAKALKKLGRVLTGKRGILSALNDFASVLKTFAQFGPKGEIGYVDMVPDGTDEDGNAKFKQVPGKVKITVVAKNIADSFGTFVDEMVKHTSMFELTGDKGKAMMKLATILMGTKAYKVFGLQFGREKPGLLEPITKFSEILNQYASFGDGRTIPILNDKGEVIKTVNVDTIAKNIINTLGSFSKTLGDMTVEADTERAQDNIGKFSDLMEDVAEVTESLDGLTKLNFTIKDLATSFGALTDALNKLDVTKLAKAGETGALYLKNTDAYKGSSERIMRPSESKTSYSEESVSTTPTTSHGKSTSSTTTKSESIKTENWNLIAAQIGDQVGAQIVAAMKKGQLKFEFSPSSKGSGVLTFD